MATTPSPQISFDEDSSICRKCRRLDYEQIRSQGLEYYRDMRFGGRNEWEWSKNCGCCRLLLSAMAAFGQKASTFISATDTFRFIVLETSPFDSSSSWLEFYRLEITDNPLIPSSIQPGWHVPEFGTPEFHSTVSNWIRNYAQPEKLPKRVLDLTPAFLLGEDLRNDISLTEPLEQTAVYVTLSHCWIGRNIIKTTKTSLSNYLSRISFKSLSKTFQEAIMVCRSLGIRYLWIDSLCILQDDRKDWEEQAAQMADIYEKASFCIASHSQEDELLSNPDKWRRTFTIVQGDQTADIHVRLVPPQPFHDGQLVSPLRAGDSLKKNPLAWNYVDLRGWCFQERILSRAVLHFTPQEVLFEANGRIENCQCGFHSYYMFRSTLDPTNKTYREQFRNYRPDGCGFISQSLPAISPLDWKRVIEMYSQRVLSHSSDILPAIAGVAQRLHAKYNNFGAKYVAGLWDYSNHWCKLEIWLCWYSDSWLEAVGSGCRLCEVYPERGGLNPTTDVGIKTDLPFSHHIPSFSWASRMGPCRWPAEVFNTGWRLSAHISRPIQYTPSQTYPFGRVLSCQILIQGPIYHGILFSLDGREVNNGGHRTKFTYFVVDRPNRIGINILWPKSFDPTPANLKEKGLLITLDAQDDIPTNNTKSVLLEMGHSSCGLTLYLVLVQSSVPDMKVTNYPQYRRIGLAFHQVIADSQEKWSKQYKFMSTNHYAILNHAKLERLYLV